MFCKTNDSIRIWTELFNRINKCAIILHSWFVLVLHFRATSKVAPIHPDFPPLPFMLTNNSGHLCWPTISLTFHVTDGTIQLPSQSAVKPLLPKSFKVSSILHLLLSTAFILTYLFSTDGPVFVQPKTAHLLHQPLLDLAPHEIPWYHNPYKILLALLTHQPPPLVSGLYFLSQFISHTCKGMLSQHVSSYLKVFPKIIQCKILLIHHQQITSSSSSL